MPAPIDSASWTGCTPRRRPFVSAFTVTVNLPTDEAADMSKLSHSDDESMRKIEADDRAGMHEPDPNWREHAPRDDVGADVRRPRHLWMESRDDIFEIARTDDPIELFGAKWMLKAHFTGGPRAVAEFMEVFEVPVSVNIKWETHGDATPRPHAGGPNTGACVGPARGAKEAMRGGGHQPAGAPSSDGLKPPSGGSSGRLPGVASWQDAAKRLRAAIEAWATSKCDGPSLYEAETELFKIAFESRPVADRPKSGKPPEPLVADFLTEQTMWEARFGAQGPTREAIDAWVAEHPPTPRERLFKSMREPQPDPQYLTANEGIELLAVMAGVIATLNSAAYSEVLPIACDEATVSSLLTRIRLRIGDLDKTDPVALARKLAGA